MSSNVRRVPKSTQNRMSAVVSTLSAARSGSTASTRFLMCASSSVRVMKK